jgi:predicted DNA binding CopG/RHH family protein
MKQSNKSKKIAQVPKFKTIQEEQDFWDTHSVLDFPDQFKEVKMNFSALKPSTERITFRLPSSMLQQVKMMSNKRDVPYQSFIKTILADRIKAEYAI